MTRLGPDKVGMFLRQQAEELTRIWRMARTAARPDVFPGLVDDLVQRFFERAGELLEDGARAEEVWPKLGGLVRWPPAIAPGEIAQEWAVLGEVIGAVSEAVNADPAVADWLGRAAAACDAGTGAIARGDPPPPGLVVATVFSSLSPRHRRAEKDDSVA